MVLINYGILNFSYTEFFLNIVFAVFLLIFLFNVYSSLVILYATNYFISIKSQGNFFIQFRFLHLYLDIFVVLFQLVKMFLIVLDNDTSSD